MNKKLKATSLTEVMIVLGVISTALVASISVLASSIARIKANEIEDSANSFMLQAVELSKSPSPLVLSNGSLNTITQSGSGSQFYFSLAEDSRNNKYLKQETRVDLTECTATSPYNITRLLDQSTASAQVCLRVKITPRTSVPGAVGSRNQKRFYEIESKVVFVLPQETRSNTILGYRYNEFQEL